MPTDEEIRARGDARRSAATIVGLAIDETEEMTPDAALAFWTGIREVALGNAPLPVAAEKTKIVPMTDAAARNFETVYLPYGKHEKLKRTVGQMMEAEPMYADWLIGEKDEFKEDLKRYLASDRAKARMAGRAM